LHSATRRRFGIVSFMTVDTFREILHRKPFEPFQVAMSSGESYNVPAS
jgi:hypothetical protein